MHRIIYYFDTRGREPARDYVLGQPKKVRAKVFKWLEKLEIHGNRLPRPYADYLRDKIYELRVQLAKDNHRILYFFFEKENIVLTHGCRKKDWGNQEIEKAIGFRKDFVKRFREGGIGL